MINIQDLEAKIISKNYDQTFLEIVKLMYYSGARVSDVLKIKRTDVSPRLELTIYQSKKSLPLIVNLNYSRDFWQGYREGKFRDISTYNRYYLYRHFDKLSISFKSSGNSNRSVTHAFRKFKAQDIYDQTHDVSAAAAALGHKSERSTEFYLENIKKGVINQGGVLSNNLRGENLFEFTKRYGKTYIRVKKSDN